MDLNDQTVDEEIKCKSRKNQLMAFMAGLCFGILFAIGVIVIIL